MIETINLLEPSADFLAPGDRIHQIDGISTIGLTNEQVMNCLLCNRDENTVIEIEYSLPEYCKFVLHFHSLINPHNIFFVSFYFKSFPKQFVRHYKIGAGDSRA